MRKLMVVAAGLTTLLLVGCAARKPPSAGKFFEQASQNLREGAYEVAIEQYRELLDEYPFSEYTEEAEFQIANAQQLAGECPEAIAAFSDFQRRHPTSAFLPRVGYLIGRCYERQMKPPDRDQSASQSAHALYLSVLQEYPQSPFADLAREELNHCRSTLARHELLVAGFYAKRRRPKAAEYRLFDLLNRFGDTEEAGQALAALGKLYEKQGDETKEALAFASLANHFPHSPEASAARAVLGHLAAKRDLPDGDPLVVLKAMVGRSRVLALAGVLNLPSIPAQGRTGMGPGVGGSSGGPFGGPGGSFGGY